MLLFTSTHHADCIISVLVCPLAFFCCVIDLKKNLGHQLLFSSDFVLEAPQYCNITKNQPQYKKLRHEIY